jgi:hypothetical protein
MKTHFLAKHKFQGLKSPPERTKLNGPFLLG